MNVAGVPILLSLEVSFDSTTRLCYYEACGIDRGIEVRERPETVSFSYFVSVVIHTPLQGKYIVPAYTAS